MTPQYINEQRGVNQQRLDQAIQELFALAHAKDTPPRVKANALAMVATFSHAQLRDLNALELERLRLGATKDAENVADTVQLVDLDHVQSELDRLRVVDQKMNRVSPSRTKPPGDSTSDAVTDSSEEAA